MRGTGPRWSAAAWRPVVRRPSRRCRRPRSRRGRPRRCRAGGPSRGPVPGRWSSARRRADRLRVTARPSGWCGGGGGFGGSRGGARGGRCRGASSGSPLTSCAGSGSAAGRSPSTTSVLARTRAAHASAPRPEGHAGAVVGRRRVGRRPCTSSRSAAPRLSSRARRPRHPPDRRVASGRSVPAMTSSVRSTSAAARAGDVDHGPRLEAAAVALARPTCTVTVTSSPEPSGRRDHANSVAPLPRRPGPRRRGRPRHPPTRQRRRRCGLGRHRQRCRRARRSPRWRRWPGTTTRAPAGSACPRSSRFIIATPARC